MPGVFCWGLVWCFHGAGELGGSLEEEKGLGLCPFFSLVTADALHALSHTLEGFQQ